MHTGLPPEIAVDEEPESFRHELPDWPAWRVDRRRSDRLLGAGILSVGAIFALPLVPMAFLGPAPSAVVAAFHGVWIVLTSGGRVDRARLGPQQGDSSSKAHHLPERCLADSVDSVQPGTACGADGVLGRGKLRRSERLNTEL
jgi:hypothetical protein